MERERDRDQEREKERRVRLIESNCKHLSACDIVLFLRTNSRRKDGMEKARMYINFMSYYPNNGYKVSEALYICIDNYSIPSSHVSTAFVAHSSFQVFFDRSCSGYWYTLASSGKFLHITGVTGACTPLNLQALSILLS
uniref:Uncharacterized protein n=1 Tax=Glossina palpalis gambiensis TaxID=67801 RepID=A0A1B0BQ42_9MUSC